MVSAKPLKIFLDLEDTIIKLWDDPQLVNVQAINSFLTMLAHDRPRVETISIFSFAIWDDKDRAAFVDRHIKSTVEQALNVTVDEWPSVEQMQQIIEKWSGFKFFDRMDFMQLHGKHDAFIKMCIAREQNVHCILIDDAVPHRTVVDHDRQLDIELMPVHKLIGTSAPPATKKI